MHRRFNTTRPFETNEIWEVRGGLPMFAALGYGWAVRGFAVILRQSNLLQKYSMHLIRACFLLCALSVSFCLLARDFIADPATLGSVPDGTDPAPGNYGAPRDVRFAVTGTAGTIDAVAVSFSANHSYVGNLKVTLVAPTGQSHLLFERTGATDSSPLGSPANLVSTNIYSFNDTATADWWAVAGMTDTNIPTGSTRTVAAGPAIAMQPAVTSLNLRFRRAPANGTWILRIEDGVAGETGQVTGAKLTLTLSGSNQMVTKAADSNDGVCNADCSLREAMAIASDGDLITFASPFFDSPRTIVLNDAPLSPGNKSLAVAGPGAHKLTISANNSSGLFQNHFNGNVVTLSGLRFTASKTQGSAIADFSNGSLVIAACEISDNLATYVVQINGNAEIYDSSITNNLAPVAIFGSVLRMERSTVFGNNASTGVSSFGGAIIDSTIVGNLGVGVNSRAGNLSLRNSVVAQNRPDLSIFETGVFASLGHNFIGNPGVFASAFNLAGDQVGTESNPLDPKLGSLSNNGGLVPTLAPISGSPLIDQGKATGFDARGVARRFDLPAIASATGGNNADIGAVEVAPIIVANLNDSGPGSLRQALVNAPLVPAVSDIWFDAALTAIPSTLVLTSGELSIDRNIAIHGPGAQKLAISANEQSRVLVLEVDRRASVAGLTLTQGNSGIFSDGIGGAAINRLGSHFSLIDSVVKDSFSLQGAGIYNYAALVVRGSTFTGNRGTAVIDNYIGALGLFSDSTFYSNNAIASGAITFNGAGGQLLNMTITNQGIGLRVTYGSSVSVRNSVIADNNIDVSAEQATLSSHGHNLIGNGWPVPTFNLLTDQVGTFVAPLNPRLSPLMIHSGQVPTRIPRADSPLLDKGLRLGMRDQRGLMGIFNIDGIAGIGGGNNADIGATEAQAIFVRNTNESGVGSLREAMLDANGNARGTDDILFGTPTGPELRGVIQLNSKLPMPTGNINLLGPGANVLSVSRSDSAPRFGLLDAFNRVQLGISGLTLSNGLDDGVAASGNDSFGGAIDAKGAELHLAQVEISGNQANNGGGGVSMFYSNGVISDSSIVANSAVIRGGGVYFSGENVLLRIEQSTISGNSAVNIGAGGIAVIGVGNVASQARLEVMSSTIAKNSGRGIYIASSNSTSTTTTTLRNTLLSENTGGNLVLDAFSGPASMESLGYNLSNTPEPLLIQPSDRVNANAALHPLADNGGPTRTHALQFGSDAIDAGIFTGRLLDARGQRRPNDLDGIANAAGSNGNDIGAVEVSAPQLKPIFANGFE